MKNDLPKTAKSKKIAGRTALILGALLMSMLVAELLARWKLPQYRQRFVHFQDAGSWRLFSWSPSLGWRGRSHFRGNMARKEFFHEVVHNDAGFRDEEHVEKASGKSRVLVLGDSFVYGVGVSQVELFSERIKKRDGSLDIVNMGVPGYSTDLEYLLLREEGMKYRPDLVVVAFYPNDIFENNLRTFEDGKWQKPFFEWNGKTLTLTNVPAPNDLERFLDDPANDERVVLNDMPALLGRVLRISVLANVLVDRAQAFPFLSSQLEHLGVLYPFQAQKFNEVFDPTRVEELHPLWERTSALIAEMKNFLQAQKIPLLVVYIPFKQQLDYKYQEITRGSGFDIDLPQQTLRKSLQSYDIPFADITPIFARRRGGGMSLYYREDPHLNSTGHSVFADALGEIIHEHLSAQ